MLNFNKKNDLKKVILKFKMHNNTNQTNNFYSSYHLIFSGDSIDNLPVQNYFEETACAFKHFL